MKSPTFTFIIFLFIGSLLKAQSPVNGFMQRTGNGSLVFSYNTESYNEVYLVPKKVNTIPIFNHITINSTSVYGTYGLSDRLNLVVNIPHIQTTGEASEQVLKNLNFENTRKGIQDISAYLKYKPLDISLGTGTFSLIGAVGVKTPLGNYKVDENLQSIVAIGNRATSLNTIVVGLFRDTSGFFVSGQAGYCLRNKTVPDAFISEFKLGVAANRFYVDAFLANQTSLSGTDILAEGFQGFFPSTKVNYTRVGINFFVPVANGFGLSGGGSQYIDGRNLGKSTSYYGAAIFSF